MASRTIPLCDFPIGRGRTCTEHAVEAFEGKFTGAVAFEGHFCHAHRVEVERGLARLGVTPAASFVDSKKRQVHRARSGISFSAHEARGWLLEQGIIESSSGRLSAAAIEAYAEAH